MQRESRCCWEEPNRSSKEFTMRQGFIRLIVAAAAVAVLTSPIWAQQGRQAPAPSPSASLPFDPHDLSGIWSRNSQGYGGGGTCRGCGDRGFSNDVPPMTPAGQK